jgi:hypothetical protein
MLSSAVLVVPGPEVDFLAFTGVYGRRHVLDWDRISFGDGSRCESVA